MDLKEFVGKVLLDITAAVDDVSDKSARKMVLSKSGSHRTVEFDVAVTVEESGGVNGGIKVLNIIGIGVSAEQQSRNSTVSRIQFGVDVSSYTKIEAAEEEAQQAAKRAYVHSTPSF